MEDFETQPRHGEDESCAQEKVGRSFSRRRFVAAAASSAAVYALGGPGAALAAVTNSAGAPIWSRIPNQVWEVGKPVFLDLAEYVSDPDGDDITFSLDQPLPEGVTLQGSVISGTPVAETGTGVYIATADDGTPDVKQPMPPESLEAQ